MTPAQYLAIRSPCLLAVETMLPKYASRRGSWSMVLTVNTGYE